MSTQRADIQRGVEFEKRFFGEQAVFDPEVLDKFLSKENFYEPFEECLIQVKKNQEKVGWQPRHPSTKMSQQLFDRVQRHLAPRYQRGLRLYCAIGSKLDYYHKIDGFFELYDVIVTFDLKVGTGFPGKSQPSADIIIQECATAFLQVNFFNSISERIARGLENGKPRLGQPKRKQNRRH